MEFVIDSGVIAQYLKEASLFAADRKENEILKCISFSVTKDLKIRAFNRIVFYSSKVDGAEIVREGTCCINASLLNQIITTISSGMLLRFSTNANNSRLSITSENEVEYIKYNLGTIPDEFPLLKIDQLRTVEFEASEIKSIIEKCSIAVSADSFNKVFQGINFIFDKGELTVISTNRNILVRRFIDDSNIDKKFSFVIPGFEVSNIIPILTSGKVRIGVNLHEGKPRHAYFKVNDRILLASLIGIEYPDVEVMIRKKLEGQKPKKITINRQSLSMAIKGTILLETDKSVTFSVKDNRLLLKSSLEEKIDACRSIVLEDKTNLTDEVSFDGNDLLKLVDVVFSDCEKITFSYYKELHPLKIDSKESGFIAYISPLMAKE